MIDKRNGDLSKWKEIDIFFVDCSGPNPLLRCFMYIMSFNFLRNVQVLYTLSFTLASNNGKFVSYSLKLHKWLLSTHT